MTSNEKLWSPQRTQTPQQSYHSVNPFESKESPPPQDEYAATEQQPYPPQQGSHYPPPPQQTPQQSYQSVNPFIKSTQSPPPQDEYAGTQGQQPHSPQQGYPPPYHHQEGSPYHQPYPQQNVYIQSAPYPSPQQGYPQQQSSPYRQQGYPPPHQEQFSGPNSQVVGEAASFYNSGPPPVVQSGTGPGGPTDRVFFDSAMQMGGVQQPPSGPDDLGRDWFSSSKNPLDPPPKMFKRPAPGHYAYINFQPLSALAVSEKLQGGFALIPPGTVPADQHPFISHDITQEDWHQFLKDFQKTAHLSPSDRLFQGMANSFMKDKIPSAKIQKRMAENKLEPVNDYLMAWNHYFFHPRRMSVVLAKGNRRFSGEIDDYPPDIRHPRLKKSRKNRHSSSRSVNPPLVTPAEPYPKGSLLAPLLNPIHKALYDTTVAIARAPGDLLHGITPGEKVDLSKSSKSSRSDSESNSGSDESTDSEEDDREAIHNLGVTDPVSVHALMQAKRTEREALRNACWAAGWTAGKEERKREREKYVQAVYYGNYGAGKEKSKKKSSKHDKEDSAGGPPTDRFRLVICYWDGQREVF